MEQLDAIFSRVGFMLTKSIGIWLSVWAIRYKAEWDYKLGETAKWVRWAVVFGMYFLAASLPGSSLAPVRVIAGFTGLLFLCWPNFAYHLANQFIVWPTARGRVISSAEDGSRWVINYSFDVGEDTFGGSNKVKPVPGMTVGEAYPEGSGLTVRYDPLNAPTESKLDIQEQRLAPPNMATSGR